MNIMLPQEMNEFSVRATWKLKRYESGFDRAGRAEENGAGVQKVAGVRQTGVAFGDVHRRAIGNLACEPSCERLLLLFRQAVPKIGGKFIRAKLAAIGFCPLFLFLNFDNSNLPKMVGGFIIQLVNQFFAFAGIGNAKQFKNRQVEITAVGHLQFIRQFNRLFSQLFNPLG